MKITIVWETRFLSALPDWQTTGSSPRGRQAGTAAAVPIICDRSHASAVALVGCGRPGELQDWPPRLQMSPRSSSRLPIRSVHFPASTFAGRANMRSSSRLDRQLYVPRTNRRHWVHEGSTTLRLLCGTRSRQTCVIPDFRSTHSEQNWNPTFSQLFDLFHSSTSFLQLFRRARQRDVH